ncbi:MAG TPA: PDZ domain-containing protein, partial [Methylomirabilota bacterium]|nr:PDZ domain-containing protein [Methylomirabilota bacterium]
RGVEEGSLAESAGVEAGDLIVSAGGKPIADADDLFDALGGLKPPFELRVVRGAEERTVTVAAPTAGGAKTERTPGDA